MGGQVVRNVEQLREARGLSFRGLAERLAALGRPILPSVLHALSKGDRRVDADDLMALAVALKVPPSAILLPRDVARDDMIVLTPTTRQRAWAVWEWADGRTPLPDEDAGDGFDIPAAAAVDFLTNGRPAIAANRDHPAIRANEVLKTRALMFLLGRESKDRVRRQLQRVILEFEELLGGDE